MESSYKLHFCETVGKLWTVGHHSHNSDPPMGNSINSEPDRTRDEASREDQDMEERQSLLVGSIDSTVGENSHRRES